MYPTGSIPLTGNVYSYRLSSILVLDKFPEKVYTLPTLLETASYNYNYLLLHDLYRAIDAHCSYMPNLISSYLVTNKLLASLCPAHASLTPHPHATVSGFIRA